MFSFFAFRVQDSGPRSSVRLNSQELTDFVLISGKNFFENLRQVVIALCKQGEKKCLSFYALTTNISRV
jgi:hypothetical protein